MKKLLFKIIIILIAIIALWTGFNLLSDISEPEFEAGEGYDTTSQVSFLGDLFPPIPVTKENGFYKLWTLSEPPDVNVNSDELFEIQKNMNDPETATVQGIKDWGENTWNKKKKEFNKQMRKKRKAIYKKGDKWSEFPKYVNRDWGRMIQKEKINVLKLQKLLEPLMERYEKVIRSEYFEDYTLIIIEKDKINFSIIPVPNLLTWIYVAKQHTAFNILNALEGDWINSTKNILDHIEFSKKAVKGSRTLITNLVGKAVHKISLLGIASIMNQPDCPEEVFELITNNLDDIEYGEYSSRKPLLAEGFTMTGIKRTNPFWQTNRTKKYYYNFITRVVNSEKTPPYKWDSAPNEIKNVKNGIFWWIQNPLGKKFFTEFNVNFPTVVLKSWHLKTTYDMVRISAELHLKYDPAKTVKENLDSLDLYNSLIDPCSGKPYIWHEKKQMLYSFGADRDDDGGKDGPLNSWDADFFLPVHLYIK